ncbi:MAG: type II secretion system F family protein [Acidobacteriota bacterium]|nr:type II secretion system F family protein [Acidobacteriota bacterium]
MVSFITIMVAVWAVAMLAWFLVSKYFKSSDIDRVKARLLGTSRVKMAKAKKGTPAEKQVILNRTDNKNQFAQAVVEKYQLGPKLGTLMEQAGLNWPPARVVNLSIMTFGSVLAMGWLFLPLPKLLTLGVALVAAALPWIYVVRKRKARLHKFEELFPETLEFVSRSMRAGHAFSVSLEMIHREFPEPISSEFRRTFEEHNLGLPIEVALQKLAKRVPSLDVHFFVSAVLLQKRTGGNLAEILDKLAYVIRERFKLRGRIRAVSAHGKMTATALSLIPVAVAVLMFYTNPEYVKFFFTDDVGQIMLGSAVVLQLIGYGIMQKIVKIEV